MEKYHKNILIGCSVALVLVVALVIGGGYYIARSIMSNFNPEDMLKPPPFPVATGVDYDWQVKDMEGRVFDMTNAKGRVVFLNFWATWCMPCVAEMPGIQRLYEGLKDDPVLFLCVSEEESSKVREFAEEQGLTMPLYTLNGKHPEMFETRSIPTTYILTPEGKVAFQHTGSAKWDDVTSFDFIRGLGKDVSSRN